MATHLKNLSDVNKEGLPDVKDCSFGVVVSEWHAEICNAMKEGCVNTLEQHGVRAENIHIIQVPGSYELPQGAKILMSGQKVDAVICIGCVIKGETKHDEYINNAVATGLMQLGLMSGKTCVFCVLTTNNEQEAIDRSGGKHGNKGVEAAITAIKMAGLKEAHGKPEKKIGF